MPVMLPHHCKLTLSPHTIQRDQMPLSKICSASTSNAIFWGKNVIKHTSAIQPHKKMVGIFRQSSKASARGAIVPRDGCSWQFRYFIFGYAISNLDASLAVSFRSLAAAILFQKILLNNPRIVTEEERMERRVTPPMFSRAQQIWAANLHLHRKTCSLNVG